MFALAGLIGFVFGLPNVFVIACLILSLMFDSRSHEKNSEEENDRK